MQTGKLIDGVCKVKVCSRQCSLSCNTNFISLTETSAGIIHKRKPSLPELKRFGTFENVTVSEHCARGSHTLREAFLATDHRHLDVIERHRELTNRLRLYPRPQLLFPRKISGAFQAVELDLSNGAQRVFSVSSAKMEHGPARSSDFRSLPECQAMGAHVLCRRHQHRPADNRLSCIAQLLRVSCDCGSPPVTRT